MKTKIIFLLLGLAFQANAQIKKVPQQHTEKKSTEKTALQQSNYNAATDYQSKGTELAERITAKDMSKHLHIIAADSMEGRETGKRGQKMAANYISGSFFYSGLQPVVQTNDAGGPSFYQPFYLIKKNWGKVEIQAPEKTYEIYDDFYIAGNSKIVGEIETEVVFGGYGIETEKYSDYKNIDVNGKAIIILNGEPKDKKGNYLASGSKEPLDWASSWKKKAALARKKGAKIIFAVQDENEFKKYLDQYGNYFKNGVMSNNDGSDLPDNSVIFLKNGNVLKDFFKLKPKKIKKELKKITKGRRPDIKNTTIKIKADKDIDTIKTENVLGYIEGTDKKDELIVISSHYDHIGINPDGQINNGADDDGSGTTAVLELAEAFGTAKSLGYGPRRSILFMTVTGEEKGLLGSEFYTEHPVFPLSSTICDLNIDMIGRQDDAHQNNADYIYLIGSDKLSSDLHKISEDMNKKYSHLSLDYTYNNENDPNRFYYRSDHYNFAKNGIPVIFYFNGVHSDYHKPTDDVDKINFQKMEKITRLVFYTAWDLANREEKIKVDSNKK